MARNVLHARRSSTLLVNEAFIDMVQRDQSRFINEWRERVRP
jgi:hypothetical protein